MDKKSVLFGLGMGIVLVSGVFYSCSKFLVPKSSQVETVAREMTDDEISEKAKKLGMVFIKELPNSSQEASISPNPISDDEVKKRAEALGYVLNPTDEPTSEVIIESTPNASETNVIPQDNEPNNKVEVIISTGDNSENIANLLFEKDLVDDAFKFNKYIVENAKSKKLIAGVYEIEKGLEYEALLAVITGKKR